MTTIEDRLRAHYADRARREPLPGPSTDEALDALLGGEHRVLAVVDLPGSPTARARWARRHQRLLAAAAAVLVAVVAVGALLATRDERTDVSTDPQPDTTTTSSPSTTSQPSTTTTTSPPPSVVTPAPDEPATRPSPAGLVVAAEGILGHWDGTQWVRWTPGDQPEGGDEYTVVGLDGVVRTQAGQVGPNSCRPEGEPTIELGLTAGSIEQAPTPIGIAGVEQPLPRAVEVLDPGAPEYQQATAEMARTLGIGGGALEVRQVVRADLDGDGTDEVLVGAERPGDGSTLLSNDVAILFVRRADGSTVSNELLIGMYPGLEEAPGADAYRVAAIADLNGDGEMEVAVRSFGYEATWTLVYATDDAGVLRQVLERDCGV